MCEFQRKTSPAAPFTHKGESVARSFSRVHSVPAYSGLACVCIVGLGGFGRACVNTSVCVRAVTCSSGSVRAVSLGAFDLLNRRFLQCEIAAARFSQ